MVYQQNKYDVPFGYATYYFLPIVPIGQKGVNFPLEVFFIVNQFWRDLIITSSAQPHLFLFPSFFLFLYLPIYLFLHIYFYSTTSIRLNHCFLFLSFSLSISLALALWLHKHCFFLDKCFSKYFQWPKSEELSFKRQGVMVLDSRSFTSFLLCA